MTTLKAQYSIWLKKNPKINITYKIWLETVFASKFKNIPDDSKTSGSVLENKA